MNKQHYRSFDISIPSDFPARVCCLYNPTFMEKLKNHSQHFNRFRGLPPFIRIDSGELLTKEEMIEVVEKEIDLFLQDPSTPYSLVHLSVQGPKLSIEQLIFQYAKSPVMVPAGSSNTLVVGKWRKGKSFSDITEK